MIYSYFGHLTKYRTIQYHYRFLTLLLVNTMSLSLRKLAKVCSLAGIEETVMNHSLHATFATQMHEQGVPEKVIQDRTGHRSLEVLCVYEQTGTV